MALHDALNGHAVDSNPRKLILYAQAAKATPEPDER